MSTRITHSWLALAVLACGLCLSPNALSANRPFPQHIDYGSDSILPNQYPRDWLDDDVRDFYDYWKQEYVVSAGQDTAGNPLFRIAFGHPDEAEHGTTVSEGQGYGMIITAFMAGYDPDARRLFDGMWRFVRQHPSTITPHLTMAWRVSENEPQEGDDDSAFDGDADIAYALLLADKQWGSQGAVDYAGMARTRIQAVLGSTIGPDSQLPLLGDWVDLAGAKYNQYTHRTSDFMPETFRAFLAFTGNGAWKQVLDTTRATAFKLQRRFSPSAGLLPDFIIPTSQYNHTPIPAYPGFLPEDDGDKNEGYYAYNAARVPFRFGLDALLNKDETSRDIVRMITRWARTQHVSPDNIVDGYNLNGFPLPGSDGFSAAFAAPLGIAAMNDPGHQDWLNQIYDAVNQEHQGYYEDSLNLLSLLVMTGNYWSPGSIDDNGNTIDTVIYENAEDGSSDRWEIADNSPLGATVSVQYDAQRASHVIALNGAGMKNSYRLGDRAGRPGAWNDTAHRILSWQGRFEKSFTFYVTVETDWGRRFLTYLPWARDIGQRGAYILIGLGTSAADGQWHSLQRDLAADLAHYEPGNRIVSVNGLFVRGNGLLDDIALSSNNNWYRPATQVSWQIQLQESVNPSYPVQLYDIDLFDSNRSLISQLKAAGKKVICYFSAGSYEEWRPDANQFEPSVLGRPLDGWPGERWLDIRSPNVRKIMTNRLDLAVEKGCDGVDPDNMDGYTNNPGFAFNPDEQLDYNRFIAREAHDRKLAVGLKNDLDQIAELVGHFDFAVNEQCFQYDECDLLTPFTQQGKPVLNIEYQTRYINEPLARQQLCSQSNDRRFGTLVLPLDLDDSFRFDCLTPVNAR